MNTENSHLLPSSLRWGIIIGVLSIIVVLLLYGLGLENSKSLSSVMLIATLALIIYSNVHYRNKKLNGYISFGKSFSHGLLVALFAGIIVALFYYIFYTYIAPESLEKLKEAALERAYETLEQMNIPEDQIDMQQSVAARFMTPTWMALSVILNNTLLGGLASLVGSIFTKKSKPLFEDTTIKE